MENSLNEPIVLSFRSYLQAQLASFVSEFKQSELAADLLAEFIIVLSLYQEEGTHLFPAVFIAEDLDDVLKVTAGVDPILIASGVQCRGEVRRAFKECAPLAEGREWAIFIKLQRQTMSYGIFRTDQSPLGPTSFERLRQSQDPQLKIIGLTRLGANFVEVRGAAGAFQYVNMSGDHEETSNPRDMLHAFTEVVTATAPAALRSRLQSFYYRVGIDILHANHGTLVAIVAPDSNMADIRDGILLAPRIDVVKGVSRFLTHGDNESYQQLLAWNQLIRRMTSMDGITVLDTSSGIVGYNCFVKSAALESKARLGGARRRAFDVLCSYLGGYLAGVIYKSQDGGVEFKTNMISRARMLALGTAESGAD